MFHFHWLCTCMHTNHIIAFVFICSRPYRKKDSVKQMMHQMMLQDHPGIQWSLSWLHWSTII